MPGAVAGRRDVMLAVFLTLIAVTAIVRALAIMMGPDSVPPPPAPRCACARYYTTHGVVPCPHTRRRRGLT